MKTWFITGASRGIGRALAQAALERGDNVVATARKTSALEELNRYGGQLLSVALDHTQPAQAREAVAKAVEHFGRIDVLVNNAGRGHIGAFEEMSDDEFTEQVATNFLGVVNVLRAALPVLRKQRAGHVMNVTSIGGRFGSPGVSAYQASKFAVEGLSEAMSHELAPLGIHMTLIEPGSFRTDWAGDSMTFAKPIEDYAHVHAFRKRLSGHVGKELGNPALAAKAMLAVADMEKPPLRMPLGTDAYGLLKRSYENSLSELNRWKETTTSTDFPDAREGSIQMLKSLGIEV